MSINERIAEIESRCKESDDMLWIYYFARVDYHRRLGEISMFGVERERGAREGNEEVNLNSGDKARELASRENISVTKARKKLAQQRAKRRLALAEEKGLQVYDFLPLSRKGSAHITGGEYASDREAEDACARLVALDKVNRQVVRRDGGSGSLVRVITRK